MLSSCALVLGGFDGLHLGHRALVSEAKKTGLSVCITTISGLKGGALFTQEEREHIFRKAGIDEVFKIPFTDEVKHTPAEVFLQTLFEKVNAKAVFCGADFRFGKGAAGTPELLKEKAPCPVHVLPLYETGGEKVAVSRIKELLKEGDMPAVNALLGEDYFVGGVVEHGRQVGRSYGFPTLNLTLPEEKILPKEGVYAGYVETPKGTFKSIINVGARPTFGVEEKKLEAYLDGFEGDLYGACVRVHLTAFLRPVVRFASPEALKEQLEKDKKSL